MIIASIQRTFTLTPLFKQEQVVKTLTDPLTDKEYREIITYRVYTRTAQVEENKPNQIDLRA